MSAFVHAATDTAVKKARVVMAISLLAISLQSFAWGQHPPASTESAASQQAPAVPATRQPSPADELEPAVDTSATVAPQEPSPAPAPSPASAKPDAAKAPDASARPRRAQDHLELDTTQITGNRELPKVLYIVPWKRSDLGDLMGRPVNSLLDEVLAPVDRDVFRRENRYYRALQPQSAPQASPAPSE
jgi:hypothetical protein